MVLTPPLYGTNEQQRATGHLKGSSPDWLNHVLVCFSPLLANKSVTGNLISKQLNFKQNGTNNFKNVQA